ncbi:glyoxalase [Photobacterium damselae subsp. damselae]|uniref:VOC family protein n=1 Tax=Photobacterium damselae TaxID=38293 RepID=UPI000D07E91C|nr:VOC family protein [Photobacterium damselae]PSB79607.1 glyoxalase [Photobacterium damselae subsp. damselae]
MFSHVMLGSNDIERSKRFYDAILRTLGYNEGVIDEKGRCLYITETGILALTHPINGEPASIGNGMTIGLSVSSPELVNAWHAVGIEAGGTPCEEPPGVRGSGSRRLYLAFLRDPDGNKLCATHFLPAE